MSKQVISAALGILCILAGLFIPSTYVVKLLSSKPVESLEQFLAGVTILKVSFVILGLLVITLGRISIGGDKSYVANLYKDSHERSTKVILAVIILIASALRLYGLDDGLWYDEILTYVKYLGLPLGEIITFYDDQNNHLLYTLLAKLSFVVFGANAWSIRLPAVVFGVGSIWALFLLGRQVANTREGLLSAMVLTFSYHHLWFSQNARGYTGLLFWTILSSWLLLRGIYKDNGKTLIGYAIAASLGMYTHMTMMVVLIGQMVMYLMILRKRRKEVWPGRWRALFLGFCMSGFFTILLYSLILPQIFDVYARTENTVKTWANPAWALLEFVKGLEISFTNSILASVALLIFAIGFYSYIRARFEVTVLFVVPVLVGVIVIMGMGYTFFPRFFFFSMGFCVLIVVRGTLVFGEKVAKLIKLKSLNPVHVGTAFCACLIFVIALSFPRAYNPKQDYKGALNFIEKSREQSDAIVTVGIPATFPYRYFYKLDWKAIEDLKELDAIRSHAKRTWLLYTMPVNFESAYPEIMESMRRDFKFIKEFGGTLNGGTIYVYRADDYKL